MLVKVYVRGVLWLVDGGVDFDLDDLLYDLVCLFVSDSHGCVRMVLGGYVLGCWIPER